MTYQRKRKGIPATFYPIKKVKDSRGNEKKVHDESRPIAGKVWIFPQRGAKAEVTGQQTINVLRIGTKADCSEVGLNSRVEFNGRVWDVVSPPADRTPSGRHTGHYSMDVRERP